MEPIGIMTLSAFLKQNGHECDMVDLSFSKDYLQEIRAFNPDIIRYSVTSGREFFYLSLNHELKNRFFLQQTSVAPMQHFSQK
jgi:hypothetical protein